MKLTIFLGLSWIEIICEILFLGIPISLIILLCIPKTREYCLKIWYTLETWRPHWFTKKKNVSTKSTQSKISKKECLQEKSKQVILETLNKYFDSEDQSKLSDALKNLKSTHGISIDEYKFISPYKGEYDKDREMPSLCCKGKVYKAAFIFCKYKSGWEKPPSKSPV